MDVARQPSGPGGGPLSTASGTAARTWPIRSADSAASLRASSPTCLTVSWTAVAKARIAGVSSVPDLMSRSCPPPCSTGTGSTLRASSSAPTPTGPPSLWPVTLSASAPEAAKSTGSWAAACTASLCSGMPYSRAMAASSLTGWTVPTSLFAHMTLTRATPAGSVSMAARSTSGRSSPVPSTSSQSAWAPSCSASQCTLSSTA